MAFSRQPPTVYTALLPCGALKQASRRVFSSWRGTQISGSVLLYWVDKSVS
jgi:hypothetical protein